MDRDGNLLVHRQFTPYQNDTTGPPLAVKTTKASSKMEKLQIDIESLIYEALENETQLRLWENYFNANNSEAMGNCVANIFAGIEQYCPKHGSHLRELAACDPFMTGLLVLLAVSFESGRLMGRQEIMLSELERMGTLK